MQSRGCGVDPPCTRSRARHTPTTAGGELALGTHRLPARGGLCLVYTQPGRLGWAAGEHGRTLCD